LKDGTIVDITNGAYIVLNGTSAKAGDGLVFFLMDQTVQSVQKPLCLLHLLFKFTSPTATTPTPTKVEEIALDCMKAQQTKYGGFSAQDVYLFLSNRREAKAHNGVTIEGSLSVTIDPVFVVKFDNFQSFFSKTFVDFGLLATKSICVWFDLPQKVKCTDYFATVLSKQNFVYVDKEEKYESKDMDILDLYWVDDRKLSFRCFQKEKQHMSDVDLVFSPTAVNLTQSNIFENDTEYFKSFWKKIFQPPETKKRASPFGPPNPAKKVKLVT